MTTPDLSKLTKDELMKLAAKRKVPVKSSMLKSEIVAVLKKEMKKAKKPAPPKKAASKAKKQVAQKTSEKNRAVSKTSVKKGEQSSAASKPKAKTTAASAKKTPTRKMKTPSARKKPVSSVTPPTETLANQRIGSQALHPKFELEDSSQETKFILGKPDMHDESYPEVYQELPANYGDNKLVLLVRDPHWCFLYWELQDENIRGGLARLNRSQEQVRHVLRIHSPSQGGTYFDTDVDFRAGNHYIQLSPPGASFYSEIGLLDHEGHFAALAVSNTVTLPLDGPSDIIDEQWMTTSENFDEIYMLSGGRLAGARPESPLGASEKISARQRLDISSPSVSSFGSREIQNPTEKSFNYWLDTELVLFGGADPGAIVKLSGEDLELRSDGTFSTRFVLPEGTLSLPVTFESSDHSESHTVAPVINRKTLSDSKEVER